MHVPIALGGRLFGVLSAMHQVPGRFGEARPAAARLARRRRGRRDLARARVRARAPDRPRADPRLLPGPPDPQTGLELGLIYEPVAHQVGGGDVFGVWTQPSGAVAVLIGDVSGKGLEVAAASAMVRFFVEARAWDSEHPAEVLAQANRILRMRLQRGGFATAFLALVSEGRLRYCNAGHPPPCLLRADGGVEALEGSGLPLGVEEDGRHEEREVEIGLGDVLFASTDGLLEARRDGAFFSDDAAARAAGGVRPHAAAAGVRRARLRRGAGVGAGAPRRRRRARAAARAGARAARRARDRCSRAGALQRSTWGSCASGSGPASCRGVDLRHRARVRGGARGASSSSTPAAGRSAAAACARSARSWPRSSACS